jgi:hypothetical protein
MVILSWDKLLLLLFLLPPLPPPHTKNKAKTMTTTLADAAASDPMIADPPTNTITVKSKEKENLNNMVHGISRKQS